MLVYKPEGFKHYPPFDLLEMAPGERFIDSFGGPAMHLYDNYESLLTSPGPNGISGASVDKNDTAGEIDTPYQFFDDKI
jgi:hypothetical protein